MYQCSVICKLATIGWCHYKDVPAGAVFYVMYVAMFLINCLPYNSMCFIISQHVLLEYSMLYGIPLIKPNEF